MPRSLLACILVFLAGLNCHAGIIKLESNSLLAEIDKTSGQWSLLDKSSGVRWPSEGTASIGEMPQMKDGFVKSEELDQKSVSLTTSTGVTVIFELAEDGQAVDICYKNVGDGNIRVLGDFLKIKDDKNGFVIVPCREGLLIPVDIEKPFKKMFGSSDYSGSHMNMFGFLKEGSGLIVTWDDMYVFPEVQRNILPGANELITTFELRRSARSLRITPTGKGNWNKIASEYRKISEKKGYVVTLKEKIKRRPELEKLIGATNLKLWHLYIQRMNKDSTEMKYRKVRWTFDEAAQIAEHMRNDLDIDRCLFVIGGWTNGGYDNGHPDILPANEPCGGNKGLIDALDRIEKLGYISCLHDNYQDMYRNAKSYDPKYTAKRKDGSLMRGGYWFGGVPDIVCSAVQLELAQRKQNLPDVQKLFSPQCYFVDTVFAAGPKECYDPKHSIDRNKDLVYKKKLCDYARETFGLFGSECGREWGIPHSDVFEGITSVFGNSFHSLKPEEIGAIVIPFWEMVYHDCMICYGKYSCNPKIADKSVAQHALYARPFFHHFNETYPDHLYWKEECGQSSDEDAAADAVKAAWGEQKQEPWCFDPEVSVFSRGDNGWAEGLDPLDAFMKNTHEILGPLNRITAHERLKHLYLSEDRTIQTAYYGHGPNTTTITVNFGAEDAEVEMDGGQYVVLPQWGFVIENIKFIAFYAKHFNGIDYETGALFTVKPHDGKNLLEAKKIRIFHGFGKETINFIDAQYKVRKEKIIEQNIK